MQPPAVSNEAETDVQRALKMDDELANFTTFAFEEHDATAENADQEKLLREFEDAVRLPGDARSSLNSLYFEELEVLESLQYRTTFFNLLAYGYKK